MIEIIYNEEENSITAGNLKVMEYTPFFGKYGRKEFLRRVLKNDYPTAFSTKINNKIICQKLGRSSVAFFKHFMGLQNKVFFKDIEPSVLFKYAYNPRTKSFRNDFGNVWGNQGMLGRLRNASPIVKQALQDNNKHIIPWIVVCGMDTSELKRYFGKSLWKKLCSFSEYRNTYLSKYAGNDVSVLKEVINVPTTLLKKLPVRNRLSTDFVTWCAKELKGRFCKITETGLAMLADTYYDIVEMCGQLGIKFDDDFDLKGMKVRHDELVEAINSKRYSREEWKSFSDLNVPDYIVLGKYEAVLIKSPYDLWEEGKAMHHCVASYASVCANGDYLVYSIRERDKRLTTLGLRRTSYINTRNGNCTHTVDIHQHYRACNKAVEDQDLLGFATHIRSEVNNTFKKEEQ